MTDTDWKEEAGMGAEPPVPESPVIPPVAEGTEPGAGELPQQGVPAEPVQESPAGQLDGPEEASSDLLPDSGASWCGGTGWGDKRAGQCPIATWRIRGASI